MLRSLCVCFMIVLLGAVCSCNRQKPFQPTDQYAQAIEFSEEKIPLESGEFIYRQGYTLKLDKSEELNFAYRLTTLKEGDIPGFSCNAEGWLIFPNQDVWTNRSCMSFDFVSSGGKVQDLICLVEVRIRKPDGDTQNQSFPFRSSRVLDSMISVPFTAGENVPVGIEFILRESYGDIFVEGMYAHHFMYRLNTLNANLQVTENGQWYSTMQSPDIRKLLLNASTTPALIPNATDTFTQFEVYVVSRSGLIQENPSLIHFKVVEGNQPVALLYSQTVVGLGSNHYSVYNSETMPYFELFPPNAHGFNTGLYPTSTGYQAINSEDFQLHLRWGYSGQYGRLSSNGTILPTNLPWEREINLVLNSAGLRYYSRITAFWLRWDGGPFPELPQFNNTETRLDNAGNSWLRVLNQDDVCRYAKLSNLPNGNHTFELMVEDLQGVLSAPVSKTIELVPFCPVSQRWGKLIIDDSPHSITYSPEDYVDTFYNSILPSQFGNSQTLDVAAQTNPDFAISPAVLQTYKLVLIHSDNPSNQMIPYHYLNGLDFYLSNQGNVIISGTRNLASMLHDAPASWVAQRFGISCPDAVQALGNSMTQNPYFVRAVGQQGYGDIPLNLDTAFSSIVASRQGLSAITHFDPSLNLNWLYSFGCKPVDSPTYPPTQETYDLLSNKYVSYRYQNEGSNLIVFGFPLSYMEQAPVAAGLNAIFTDMFGNLTQRSY
ncbi:MAG: hypothetical protein V3576_02435 [Candidatus Cloacimonadota bacterium]